MKKEYITPLVNVSLMEPQPMLDAASKFDITNGDQEIVCSEDEYNGEFQARRNQVWDNYDEEDGV